MNNESRVLFFAVFLLCLGMSSLVASSLPFPWSMAVVPALGLGLPVCMGWRFFYRRSLSEFFLGTSSTVRGFFPFFFISLFVGSACFAFLWIGLSPLIKNWLSFREHQQLLEWVRPRSGLRPLCVDLLCLAAAPAFGEEVLFRGILLHYTQHATAQKSRYSFHTAFVYLLTSGLFAVSHASWARFLPTLLLGVAFGGWALCTRSIGACIVMHFMHNAWVVLLTRSNFQDIPLSVATQVVISLGALLVLGAGFYLSGRLSTKQNLNPPLLSNGNA